MHPHREEHGKIVPIPALANRHRDPTRPHTRGNDETNTHEYRAARDMVVSFV